MNSNLMDKVVSLCKRRGFIFPSSDIYGGLSNTWDYGPYGVELKNNVKRAWWKANVYLRDDVYGMDAAILMHPKVWEASGHTVNFADFVVECKNCHKRMRPEEIVEQEDIQRLKDDKKYEYEIDDPDPVKRYAQLALFWDRLILFNPYREAKEQPKCLYCGGINFTSLRQFNLMFKTYQGPIEDAANLIYLRPETAQGMFVNFANILNSCHPKLPFGLAQIGKAFRNEITPGNFTFRTREFEQMEIEYFVPPNDADRKLEEWIEKRFKWYVDLGIRKQDLRKRPHSQDELAHYAAACTDIEYNFPFGWQELEGIANRTDFDLKQHEQFAESGTDLTYFDNEAKQSFYPYIIEPSGGVDRATLAFLVDAYHEEEVKGKKRVFLSLHSDLAPLKIAVLPLLANRPEIVELAKGISQDLKKDFFCTYDDTAAIGKLYRRQDEIGTPYCLTVDVQSLEDAKITVRDRDTMSQERVGIDSLKEYLSKKLSKG